MPSLFEYSHGRPVPPWAWNWPALIIGVAAVLAWQLERLFAAVPAYGRLIPQPDLLADYVHGWIWAVLIGVLILVLPLQERRAVLLLWAAKVLVTLWAMLYYEGHYGLDAYGYFGAGAFGQVRHFLPVLGDGTTTTLRLSALVIAVVGPSYHATKVVFALVGLGGCYAFYRAFCLYLGRRMPALLLILGLYPSILFWSSILGKDPIVFLGVGLYSLGAVGWLRTARLRYLAPLVAGILVAMIIREWYVVITVPPVLMMAARHLRRPTQRLAVFLLGPLLLVGALTLFRQQLLPHGFADLTATADATIRGFSTGGSGQRFGGFHSTAGMLLFWPWGAFTALFRPLPWDARNAFSLLAALEDTALLLLCLNAVRHFRWRLLRDPVLGWAFAYLACWTVLYGFAGFANLGAADRFRLEVLPLLLGLGLLLGTARGRALSKQCSR